MTEQEIKKEQIISDLLEAIIPACKNKRTGIAIKNYLLRKIDELLELERESKYE